MLSLNLLKKHLNLDINFKEDDEILLNYLETAEHAVINDLDKKNEEDLYDENGDFKPTIRQAILFLAGSFYENREAVVFSSVNELPLGYNYLNMLEHDYSI